MVQSYARAERIRQSLSVIINSHIGNRAGVWMTSCPEEMVLRICGFWKEVVEFSAVGARSWVFQISTSRDHHKMRRACKQGQHSMVSIDFKSYISLLVSKDQSQKLINPFVSETTESAYICICICIVFIDIIMPIQNNKMGIPQSPNLSYPGHKMLWIMTWLSI